MTTLLTTAQITHNGVSLYDIIEAGVTVLYENSFPWDPAAIADGDSISTTVAMPGTQIGDYVQLAFTQNLAGLTLTGYVSSSGNVTAVLANNTGSTVNLSVGNLYVRVTRIVGGD